MLSLDSHVSLLEYVDISLIPIFTAPGPSNTFIYSTKVIAFDAVYASFSSSSSSNSNA